MGPLLSCGRVRLALALPSRQRTRLERSSSREKLHHNYITTYRCSQYSDKALNLRHFFAFADFCSEFNAIRPQRRYS